MTLFLKSLAGQPGLDGSGHQLPPRVEHHFVADAGNEDRFGSVALTLSSSAHVFWSIDLIALSADDQQSNKAAVTCSTGFVRDRAGWVPTRGTRGRRSRLRNSLANTRRRARLRVRRQLGGRSLRMLTGVDQFEHLCSLCRRFDWCLSRRVLRRDRRHQQPASPKTHTDRLPKHVRPRGGGLGVVLGFGEVGRSFADDDARCHGVGGRDAGHDGGVGDP
jgi:hypothetical protein